MRNSLLYISICVFAIASIVNRVEARMTMVQIQGAMKPVSKTCVQKTGVDKVILEGTKTGSFPADRDLMCYHACLLKMMKALSKDGKIVGETLAKQVDLMMQEDLIERTKAVVLKCSAEATSDDPCEASWQFIKCFYVTDSDLYFFP